MKKIYCFIIFISFLACNNEPGTSFDIPELLDRSEKIQYFNEWSTVRSNYKDLSHILIHQPAKVEAWLDLANLFIAEARVTGEHGHYYPAALKCVEQALSQKKLTKDQKFQALSAKASIQLSLHHFNEANQTAEEARNLNPYNALIYGALIDANVELAHYDEAVRLADKMVSMRPDLRSYSRVSYLRELFGMPEEAIQAMQMAVEAGSPGSEEKSWAALQLAQLCLRYGKTAEAESILNQILEERSDYPFALATLGEVYAKQGNLVQAEDILKKACSIIPEVGFYIQLAQIYKDNGRATECNQLVETILTMMDDDQKNGHNMSLEYARVYTDFLNQADKALDAIREDQKMRPENIDVNLCLAKIYLLKKDPENVEKYLERAQRTNSKNPAIQDLKDQLLVSISSK